MSVHTAEKAVQLAKSQPRRALEVAATIIASNDTGHATATALWATGQAHHELGDNRRALTALLEAAELARDPLRSRIIVTIAAVESSLGRPEDAESRLIGLVDHADPTVRGLAISQLGLLRLYRGDAQDALADLERSLQYLQHAPGEQAALARVRGNIGYCRIMLGDYEQAVTDLTRCLDEARATDQDTVVASSYQNLGYARSRLGHLPDALADLEMARRHFQELGDPSRGLTGLFDDLAETYRLAGLARDAVRYARLSTWVARRGDNLERLGEAEYRRAVCLLELGNTRAALAAADEASRLFAVTGRVLWRWRADLVAMETLTGDTAGPTEEGLIDRAIRTAEGLLDQGCIHEARVLMNRVAQRLLAGDRIDEVHSSGALSALAEDSPSQVLAVPDRLEVCYSAALLDVLRDRSPRESLRAARALIEQHALALGDQELRSGTARLAGRFRSLAVGDALKSGEAWQLLEAEETWRALTLELPRAAVPDDKETADLLVELRHLTSESIESETSEEQRTSALADVEDRLRRRSMILRRGRNPADTSEVASPRRGRLVERVRATLGDSTFLEWLEHRGRLIGIEVAPGREERQWDAGPVDRVARTARYALRSVNRINTTDDEQVIRRLFADLVDDCEMLRSQLWPPDPVAGGPLIVVPPLALMALPWRLIAGGPSGDVSVTVALSASTWTRVGEDPGVTAGRTTATATMFVGPGLGDEAAEPSILGLPGLRTYTGSDATAAAFKDALSTSNWLHASCHGHFRADSPRFSSLQLADGPFTLFELDALDRVPDVVVLAACSAGRISSVGGAEPLGTAPALISAGASMVVAPIAPVRDRETNDVMRCFYDSLGLGPAAAAQAMGRAVSGESPQLVVTAAAFQVLSGSAPQR